MQSVTPRERIELLKGCIRETFTSYTLGRLEELAKEIAFSVYNGEVFIFTAGNGGSHAIAEHMVAELSWRIDKDRPLHIPAVCLTSNSSVYTALVNDDWSGGALVNYMSSFENRATGKRRFIIGFTTSGRSENIKQLMNWFDDIADTVLFTGRMTYEGFDKYSCPEGLEANYTFGVYATPEEDVPVDVIQEIHLIYMHLLCDMIYKELT